MGNICHLFCFKVLSLKKNVQKSDNNSNIKQRHKSTGVQEKRAIFLHVAQVHLTIQTCMKTCPNVAVRGAPYAADCKHRPHHSLISSPVYSSCTYQNCKSSASVTLYSSTAGEILFYCIFRLDAFGPSWLFYCIMCSAL